MPLPKPMRLLGISLASLQTESQLPQRKFQQISAAQNV
jgi:hypothetical protein